MFVTFSGALSSQLADSDASRSLDTCPDEADGIFTRPILRSTVLHPTNASCNRSVHCFGIADVYKLCIPGPPFPCRPSPRLFVCGPGSAKLMFDINDLVSPSISPSSCSALTADFPAESSLIVNRTHSRTFHPPSNLNDPSLISLDPYCARGISCRD